jgi:hypothetical protein
VCLLCVRCRSACTLPNPRLVRHHTDPPPPFTHMHLCNTHTHTRALRVHGMHVLCASPHAMSPHQTTLQLETDTADMLNEMIHAVRNGGRISIVGV